MAAKKVLLFIVEGRSDAAGAKTQVNGLVEKFIMKYHLQPGDLLQVIRLMDTDGAFVPESAIMHDPQAAGFEYKETCIAAQSREAVMQRNETKGRNMLLLAHMGVTFKKIPYEAYFCSRNLEHALSGICQDCSPREKLKLSDQFDERYRGLPHEFLEFISRIPLAVPANGYGASWDYISEPGTLHSPERGCNSYVFLNKILNDPALKDSDS